MRIYLRIFDISESLVGIIIFVRQMKLKYNENLVFIISWSVQKIKNVFQNLIIYLIKLKADMKYFGFYLIAKMAMTPPMIPSNKTLPPPTILLSIFFLLMAFMMPFIAI